MNTEPAVSYDAAVPGTPVLTRNGTEIGTLEHVLEVPGEGVFDGLVVATDWGLRSNQDDPDSTSFGGQNVFDVYTKSDGTALDGTKYNTW